MQITRSFLNAIIYTTPFDKVSITTFWPQIVVNQISRTTGNKTFLENLCNDLFDALFLPLDLCYLHMTATGQCTAFEVSSMKAGNFYQCVSPTGTTKQEAFDNMWNKYSTANAADGEDWGELSLGIAYTSGGVHGDQDSQRFRVRFRKAKRKQMKFPKRSSQEFKFPKSGPCYPKCGPTAGQQHLGAC